jgi:hypothetical protein
MSDTNPKVIAESTRAVVWFSAGAASAVTAKLAIQDYQSKGADELVIAYINPGSEHVDNLRFVADCEDWFGYPVVRLKSDRYTDTWDVWEKRRFLVGPAGALCTTELKKMVRYGFERPSDIQAFGYTSEETHRAARFEEQNPGVALWCPLVEHGLNKRDCLAIVERSGIALPAMYLLGYQNNNCIGCPKGGMGYWNQIRKDFPDVFARMARLERELKHSILKDKNGPLWLDELDPNRGRFKDEPMPECSLICASAEDYIDGEAA